MRSTFKNFALAFAIFSFVVLLGTCGVNQIDKIDKPDKDTTLIHLVKQKVSALQEQYQSNIKALELSKDSLQTKITQSQKAYKQLSVKAKTTELNLVKLIQRDTVKFTTDSIKPVIADYIALQAERDSLCRESITNLETLATKQDSIISFKNKELLNQRDINEIYRLKEQALTEQLNTAYKAQRKAVLKARLYKGAALLLTGISSALIINQTLK